MEYTVTYTKSNGRKGMVIVRAKCEKSAIKKAKSIVIGSDFRDPRRSFSIFI